jgi:hypothetical protein
VRAEAAVCSSLQQAPSVGLAGWVAAKEAAAVVVVGGADLEAGVPAVAVVAMAAAAMVAAAMVTAAMVATGWVEHPAAPTRFRY